MKYGFAWLIGVPSRAHRPVVSGEPLLIVDSDPRPSIASGEPPDARGQARWTARGRAAPGAPNGLKPLGRSRNLNRKGARSARTGRDRALPLRPLRPCGCSSGSSTVCRFRCAGPPFPSSQVMECHPSRQRQRPVRWRRRVECGWSSAALRGALGVDLANEAADVGLVVDAAAAGAFVKHDAIAGVAHGEELVVDLAVGEDVDGEEAEDDAAQGGGGLGAGTPLAAAPWTRCRHTRPAKMLAARKRSSDG